MKLMSSSVRSLPSIATSVKQQCQRQHLLPFYERGFHMDLDHFTPYMHEYPEKEK